MPTFGDTTPGAADFPTSNDRAIVRKFTLTDNADLVSITLAFDGSGAAADNHKGVIYADSAGSPGALVAVSSPGLLGIGGTSLTLAIAGTLAPGDYWIGGLSESFNARWVCDSGISGLRQESVTYASPASTFGTPAGTTTDGISAYVTYNLAGSLPTNPGSDVTIFGWVPTPAGSCAAAIDESGAANDTDYVTSPDLRAAADPLRMTLAGAVLAGTVNVAVRASVNSGTGNLTVRFFDAGGSQVGVTSPQALTTTPTTYNLPVTLSGTATQVQIEVTT